MAISNIPHVIQGRQFFTNPNLTIPGPIVIELRTWRERLFSRPWRPWVPTKSVQTYLADPQIYQIDLAFSTGFPLPGQSEPDFAFVCHPSTLRNFVNELERATDEG